MNCNKCKFHETIPGDAHVSCTILPVQARGYAAVLLVHSIYRIDTASGILVTFEPHGVDSGWCNWPLNYDPIWVKFCNQFVAC